MDNPFDRTNIGLRERPVSRDLNQAQSQADRTIRDVLRAMLGARTSAASSAFLSYSGFIGNGFSVVPSNPVAMSVQVSAGHGFINDPVDTPTNIGATDLEGVDDRSAFKPVYLISPVTFPVATAPGPGQSRIDIVEVKVDRRLENSVTRKQLDIGTESFVDHSFFKTLAFGLDGRTGIVSNPAASTAGLSYKIGTAAATGTEVEPTATAGYVKVARINVGPSVTTITETDLVDRRPMLGVNGVLPIGGTWFLNWNGGTPIVTVVSYSAPPGIKMGFDPGTVRGAGDIWIVGGQIEDASIVVTAAHVNGLALTDRFALGIQSLVGATNRSDFVAGGPEQAAAASATPPVIAGIGSRALKAPIFSRFVTQTGVSNQTDTSLELALIQLSGTLRYA